MQSVPITTDVVSSNLDQGEVYNIMWWSVSVTCDRSVDFSGSSNFLHPWKWPPRYNWNIVESGVKHHQTNNNEHCSVIMLLLKMSADTKRVVRTRTPKNNRQCNGQKIKNEKNTNNGRQSTTQNTMNWATRPPPKTGTLRWSQEETYMGASWSWSYGSWFYNYIFN